MAELADALDLGSSAVKGVQVQVLFPAPKTNPLVCNTLLRRTRLGLRALHILRVLTMPETMPVLSRL